MSMSFVLFVPFVAIPPSIFRLFVQSYRACFDHLIARYNDRLWPGSLHAVVLPEIRETSCQNRIASILESMQIVGLDHIVIRCVDAKRMVDFYCGALGCRL